MLTKWLVKTFVKRPEDTDDERVRYTYGRLAGAAGLTANVLLFAAKLAIGALSGSVAILADAFNNLSDAGSSIVTLVGFKLSSAPPDAEHPFGHGRMEYLSALGVAALIMAAGFELFLSAVDKIRHPALPEFGVLTIVVLALAIAVKLWMALFYKKIGNTIRSEALKASCADSRNDVICTGVVLLTSLIGWLSGVAIDGYVGLLVALFVIWSGFTVIKETVSPLLGQAPDPEMVQDIKNTVMAHPGIIGVHDLIIHNYGPGRLVLSLHAEVSCHEDMMRSHDLIDCVERELSRKYRAIACIHMDPVDSGNEEVEALKITVETILEDIDPRLTMHDFRVVFGETHTNLIFDVVAPFDFKDEASVKAELQRRVTVVNPQLFTVVTVEHSFT
ncbi:MAG: cation transporter [Oscillospiraceae bacterium]|nr:cation transporter [Oscillospiraceae bacterium]